MYLLAPSQMVAKESFEDVFDHRLIVHNQPKFRSTFVFEAAVSSSGTVKLCSRYRRDSRVRGYGGVVLADERARCPRVEDVEDDSRGAEIGACSLAEYPLLGRGPARTLRYFSPRRGGIALSSQPGGLLGSLFM